MERETHPRQHTLEERPLHPIISFGHIKFQRHNPILYSLFLHVMKAFKRNESIISDKPVRHKSALGFTNNTWQYNPHPVCNNLCNNLKDYITKTYRTEL